MQKLICIFLLSFNSLLSSAQSINELPIYGNLPKTPKQKKADEVFGLRPRRNYGGQAVKPN